MNLHIQSMCLMVMKSVRPYLTRSGNPNVKTIANPAKTAPATKYGGKMVVCHPGMIPTAKSKETMEWDGKNQRGGKARQNVGRLFVAHPMTARTAPAKRRRAVGQFRQRMRRLIAQSGDVRHEAEEPEQQRDSEVGGNRENVPTERRPILRPHSQNVRVGEQPVIAPGPSGVQKRVTSRRRRRRKWSSPPRSG